MIGWSYIPPSKDKVEKAPLPQKETYPSEAEVTINDILNVLPKGKKEADAIKEESENYHIPKQKPSRKEKKRDTIGLNLFERKIANMKNTALPYKQFAEVWNGKGKYRYLNKTKYEITGNEKYREFVPTQLGLVQRIENETGRKGFKSYKEKAFLVEKYTSILKNIHTKKRANIITSLIDFKNEDFEKTILSLDVLKDYLGLFSNDDVLRVLNRTLSFLSYNSNDGVSLLVFEKEILPKFSKPERYVASNIIKSELGNGYNYNVNGLRESTLSFIPFLNKIDSKNQAIALNYYYEIYRSKNSDRLVQIQNIEDEHNRKIASIDTEFAKAKMEAEANHLIKKEKKSFWRSKSIQGIGVALGTILIITVILLLLSMIRNVNKLAEAMLENNAQKNK